MAIFPKVQSPCPYKSQLASVMDGDMCRMCKRQVFDLSAMSDGERVAFMKGCVGEEVCVSYKLPFRPALAAAVIAAAALAAPTAALACPDDQEWVVVGGIKDTANVEFARYDPADNAVPELPVVYEDKTAAPAPLPAPADQVAPTSTTGGEHGAVSR